RVLTAERRASAPGCDRTSELSYDGMNGEGSMPSPFHVGGTPPPSPLPGAERGRRNLTPRPPSLRGKGEIVIGDWIYWGRQPLAWHAAPPLRAGEGAGGWGSLRVMSLPGVRLAEERAE